MFNFIFFQTRLSFQPINVSFGSFLNFNIQQSSVCDMSKRKKKDNQSNLTTQHCHHYAYCVPVLGSSWVITAGGIFNQQLYGKCNNEILLTLKPRCRPSIANSPIQTKASLCLLLMNYTSASVLYNFNHIMKFPEPLVESMQLCKIF